MGGGYDTGLRQLAGSYIRLRSSAHPPPIRHPSNTHSTHPTNLTPPATLHSLFRHPLSLFLSSRVFFSPSHRPLSLPLSLVFYLRSFFPPPLATPLLPPFMSPRLDIIAEHCMLLTPSTTGPFSVMADTGNAAWILIPIRRVMDGRHVGRSGRFVEMEIAFSR